MLILAWGQQYFKLLLKLVAVKFKRLGIEWYSASDVFEDLYDIAGLSEQSLIDTVYRLVKSK